MATKLTPDQARHHPDYLRALTKYRRAYNAYWSGFLRDNPPNPIAALARSEHAHNELRETYIRLTGTIF